MKSCPADIRSIELSRWDGKRLVSVEDVVAAEEPLEIRVNGRSLAVVMRTPGHDRELVAGFLVTEGVVRDRGDILDLVYCRDGAEPSENVLDAILAKGVRVDWERMQRNLFASSSCGVCGKASIESVHIAFEPLRVRLAPRAEVVAMLPERLRQTQMGFDATGGLHASGLFDSDGRLLVLREDVGRHNGLDKVVGWAFFAESLPLAQRILLVSGRVSFELMQKALAAGIPCVAAISAPTSLAVEFARASGQSLIGFVRGGRMNVYAGTLSP